MFGRTERFTSIKPVELEQAFGMCNKPLPVLCTGIKKVILNETRCVQGQQVINRTCVTGQSLHKPIVTGGCRQRFREHHEDLNANLSLSAVTLNSCCYF